AARELPWWKSAADMAHMSLWTGNNSFTTFSSATLTVVLLLLLSGLVVHLRPIVSRPWRVIWIAVFLFVAGLAFINVAFFASSHGAATVAISPWYSQVLLAPGVLLAVNGMMHTGRWGRAIFAVFALLWAYLISATYLLKLVPMYSGYAQPRVRLAKLWAWYVS